MGWRQYTPSSNATTLESKKSEPRMEPNIGDIRAPHLIDLGDRHIPKQVRVNPMPRMGLRRTGLGIERFQTHLAH